MPATRRQSTRLAAHSSAVQAASPTSTSFRPQSHHAGRRRSSVFTPSTSRRGSLVDAFAPPLPSQASSAQVALIDQLPKAAGRTFAPAPHEPAPCTTSKSKRVQIAAKKKGEGYVPRSPNCFLMFRNWMISEGKIPTGIMNNTTVSKVISAAWKLCSDEEKGYWRDLAAKAKYEHSLKYPEYRYQPKHQPRSQKGKEAREKAMAKPKSAPVQKDGSVLMNPARPFGRPSKKNRGKLTNPHQDARNEAQAQFVQSVLRDNLSQGELEMQLEEFLADWDRQHPVESFPEFYSHMLPKEQSPVDLPFPLQDSGETVVPMPDASQLPAMDPLLYPSSSSSRYGSPILQAPELHQPQATRPLAPWVMGPAPTMLPRRSLSVQPGDMGPLNYPAAPFFTDSIQEAVAPSNQTRAWLGHRRSSSVGALQYADLGGSGRRPSTAQVLYPNAWHGQNDFLPAPQSTYQTQPMANDDIQLRPIIFNDPFSPAATTSQIEKPTLAPLSVASFAPHQVDAHLETSLRRLSLFNKMELTGPYSAGGAFGGNSSVPSSTFSQSQRSSPDSFAPSAVPVYNYGATLEHQQPASSYQDFSGFPAMYSVKNEEFEFDAAASGWHASATSSSASPDAGMEPIDCDMLDDYMQFPLAHDLHDTSSSL